MRNSRDMFEKRVFIVFMLMIIMINGYSKSEDIDWSRIESYDFDLEPAHIEAIETWMRALEHKPRIVIVNMSSRSLCQSTLVVNEAELFLKDNGHNLVDRDDLNRIRREKNVRLNDTVNDETLRYIGILSGADTVISISQDIPRGAWLRYLTGRKIPVSYGVRILHINSFDCSE